MKERNKDKELIYCKQRPSCGYIHAPNDIFCQRCGDNELTNIYVQVGKENERRIRK